MLNKEKVNNKFKQHPTVFDTLRKDNIQKPGGIHQDLKVFFNAMDEVFFSVDMVNLRVIQISPACEKLYGYKPADFLSDYLFWFKLIHPEDKHIIEKEDEILARGEQVNNQYRIIREDKTIRWVESKIIPGLDKTGKLTRIDGITRDVTARKEAEEKLRQSEARYRQIVETSQEGIWTIDENQETNFVNKKISDILGYSREEMIGKKPYDFMDEKGKVHAIKRMERSRQGIKENLDIRYVTKGGKDVWANISANPIFDDAGKYKGSLAMVTDITRRKLGEEALKKSEANLRAVFENTDSSYVLFNDEMEVISFNTLAQKFSQEQNNRQMVLNSSMRNYFSDERWVFVQKILDEVTRNGTAEYELSYIQSDGSLKWFHVRWLIVKNSENNRCGYILANKEITEAKNAALEREKITADLIQHNKDLEQFTYVISHNLRAPVANILGLSEMLKEHSLEPDESADILNRISTSIKSVDTVISDLNLILQVRAPLNEKKEIVYFRSLLDEIKTSIYTMVLKENVEFQYCFAEVESIFTIRSYIYSVLYNLTSNSIKFRKADVHPVINIKTILLKNKIELRFKDNCKGIDLEKNGFNLFGLYKRFDTSVEGKGMGLFMVKTQVEAIGGTINIKSRLGEGTEFIIQLPI